MYEHDPSDASATDDADDGPRYSPDDLCEPDDAGCEHALLFDADRDYVEFLDTSALAAIDRGPFTLELWFRGPPDDQRAHPRLLTSLDRDGGRGLEIGFTKEGQSTPGFSIETPEINLFVGRDRIALDGGWHHLALRREDGRLDLFHDGVVVYSTDLIASPLTGAQPLWLGRGVDEPDESAFLGLIAELRLWSVAREDAEIMARYDARLRGDEPGLVGYWPLSIGGGQRALDQVGDAAGVLGGDLRSSERDPSWVSLPAPFIDAAP